MREITQTVPAICTDMFILFKLDFKKKEKTKTKGTLISEQKEIINIVIDENGKYF